MTVAVWTERSSPQLGSKPVLPEGPIVVPGNTDEVGTPVVGLTLVGIPKVEFPVDGVLVDGDPVVRFPVDGVPVVGVLVELKKSYTPLHKNT